MEQSSSRAGFGLASSMTLVGVVLVALKLVGVIQISWWWIAAFLLFPILGAICLCLVLLLIGAAKALEKIAARKSNK